MTSEMISTSSNLYTLGKNVYGDFGIASVAIACSNTECAQVTIDVWIAPRKTRPNTYAIVDERRTAFFSKRLIPESLAKPQPDFIPKALREDYLEACLIRDLSPKASATLSRRCLQGMIRDFCGIKKATLHDEIAELRKLVDSERAPTGVSMDSVDAIDDVRSIGNIGAHMEKEIDHIVPVDPEEAQLLIELIESLFEDWYIAREKRVRRFSGIKSAAEGKKKMISELRARAIEGPKE